MIIEIIKIMIYRNERNYWIIYHTWRFWRLVKDKMKKRRRNL